MAHKCKYCGKPLIMDEINNNCNSTDLIENIKELKKEIHTLNTMLDYKDINIEKIDIAYENKVKEINQLNKEIQSIRNDYNELKISKKNTEKNVVNYNKIKQNLHHLTIDNLLSEETIVDFLLDIFKNNIVLLNDKKSIGYIEESEEGVCTLIKDKNADSFIFNSISHLRYKSNDILSKTDFENRETEKKSKMLISIINDIADKKDNYKKNNSYKLLTKHIFSFIN